MTSNPMFQEPVHKLEVKERVQSFREVALGYDRKQAVSEAKRCLQCKIPRCIEGCPVDISIPDFIKKIQESKFIKALQKIKDKNYLPSICGRVCPQENQCMGKCVLGVKGDPINIGALERFVADYEQKNKTREIIEYKEERARIAVVGSGPAGLTAASELARLGYRATVFEALHSAGGVLTYGIPEFRLPKSVVRAELKYIQSLGVEIVTDTFICQTYCLGDLFDMGYEAVFIGAGAGLPRFLGINGENLNGIYSANEFLLRVNLMKAYRFPEYNTPLRMGSIVAVIGGGNVALDAARSALRLGKEVTIVYRRTKEFMPARYEEVKNAEEEGIRFVFLATPIRFIGDNNGRVKSIECLRMSEPNQEGERNLSPIDNSNFIIKADTVIVAIGQKPNSTIAKKEGKVKIKNGGTIQVNPNTYMTSYKGVFAAGDVVTGNATVISAMEGGKKAANAIDSFLKNREKTKEIENAN